VALVESGLSRFEQETRRRGREVRVLQFLFRGCIERNRAQRLRARPAVLRGTGIGSSNERSAGGGGIFSRNSAGFFFAWAQLGQARCRRIAEIGFGEPVDRFRCISCGALAAFPARSPLRPQPEMASTASRTPDTQIEMLVSDRPHRAGDSHKRPRLIRHSQLYAVLSIGKVSKTR